MYTPVNATHKSRITSKNFMYGYKLWQMHRWKLKISIYAHTLTHIHVRSYLLNLPLQLIQSLSLH